MRNLEAVSTNTVELLGVDGVTNLSTIARACPVRPSKAHTDLMKREHEKLGLRFINKSC